jgi:serine/threonine-protein kinase
MLLGAQGPSEAASLTAADEVITLEIKLENADEARLTLKRYRRDGSLHGKPFSCIVPIAKPRQVEPSLEQYLYARFRPGDSPRAAQSDPSRDGTPDDRDALAEIRGRLQAGKVTDTQPDLDRLDTILKRSPDFLDAELLAVRYRLNRFRSHHEPQDLKRAQAIAAQAAYGHPSDQRTFIIQFKVAVAGGQLQEAQEILDRHLPPNDPENMELAAELASRQGDLPRALVYMEKVIQRAGSWQNRYWYADYLTQSGQIREARNVLESLLHQLPENNWALELKAHIELLYGEPSQAAELYRKLIRSNEKRAYHVNLGTALALLHDPGKAKKELTTALTDDPLNAAGTLDLAEQELALGDRETAIKDFGTALAILKTRESAAPLHYDDEIVKALCLARLGRAEEAIEPAEKAVLYKSNDPEILQSAAQVYVLAGHHDDAILYARKARQRGLSPYWFKLPVFKKLRRDPEFQKLVPEVGPEGG